MSESLADLPRRAVLYYGSQKNALDGLDSFEFWFNSAVVRIVADKPFVRGDMCEVLEVDDSSRIIKVRVLQDEPYEKDLPVLVMAVSRIYFNEYSEFGCFPNSEQVKVLSLYTAVKDRNLAVCGVFLVPPGSSRVVCICSRFQTDFEWIFNTEYKG